MDIQWFKKRQKQLGVTSHDIGAALSRDRTVVSKILNGHQKMSLDQAKIFARVLEVPIDEVLVRAGLTDPDTAASFQPGFSDSDAARWIAKDDDRSAEARIVEAFGGGKPGIDVWRVKTDAVTLAGYMPGDFIMVDTNARDRTKAGDIVLAQVYDNQTGSANTLLRRNTPPVLVAASANLNHATGLIVDYNNVVIMGKVTASWRT